MTQAILPGATIGILGSGQLGRMLAVAARQFGYGVQIFSPDTNTPAGQVSDREWGANYENFELLKKFASRVDVVTLEFENVPVETLRYLEQFVPVRPGPQVLEVAQNRIREKTGLRALGLPTADFHVVNSLEELEAGLAPFQNTGILKTASWGYDGKGQKKISPQDDLAAVWSSFSGQPVILESIVDFSCEMSVIAARNPQGEVRCYDAILNKHENHILDVSISPASELTPAVQSRAREIAETVMRSLDVVGVLCVEMFLTRNGEVLINEIAPRTHNSGHLTIESHVTSQFEQQLRAVCGLPLGCTSQIRPAAMANILGHLWVDGRDPDWNAALTVPGVHLHLYGKPEARVGRKMGHMTCLAENAETAEATIRKVRDQLIRR